MTSIHEPTPDFERFLEWQVTSALRRQDRFASPAPAGPRRSLSAAAVVVVSLLVGAAAGAAPGRIQDNQQRTVLLQQQQGDLQVAQMQVTLAETEAQKMKRRADIGMASPQDVAAANRQRDAMVLKVQRIQLGLEEVQRSGRAVQDDVTSPRVGGRDFVMERLALDQKQAAMVVADADRNLREIQKRYDVGLAMSIELQEAQAALLRAAGEMKSVIEKIALRGEFVAGRISVPDATRKRLLIAARTELEAALGDLEILSKRYELLQKQQSVGVTGDVDVVRAQLDMLSRKQDVDRLRARVAALERAKNE